MIAIDTHTNKVIATIAIGQQPVALVYVPDAVQTLILPNLSEFLAASNMPENNDERIAMTGARQATRRTVASATLWSAIFSSDPTQSPRHRMAAILAASQAGCGQGADAITLNDAQRRAWRDQACTWLAAELRDATAASAPSELSYFCLTPTSCAAATQPPILSRTGFCAH